MTTLSRYAEVETLLTSAVSGLTARYGPDHEQTQRGQTELDALRTARAKR